MKYKFLIFYLFIFSQKSFSQNDSIKQVEKVSETKYRIGKVFIDTEKKEIELSGYVNMDSGLVELIACAPFGKVHESIFVWDVVPSHLQISLILLGLNYGGGVNVQGDSLLPKGDKVDVFISWKKDGKFFDYRAEECAINVVENKPLEKISWIFSGSRVVNGIFMADVEKSLLTTYRDPNTILDNPHSSGTNDAIFIANSQILPAKKTPIKIKLKPVK